MKNTSPSTNHLLSHTLFTNREYGIRHLAYDKELSFYNAVKSGNPEMVKSLMLPLKNEFLGVLSKNPLRNLKYHLTITIALITRFCIEGGLPEETAYTLSDIYIQKADICTLEDEVTLLHRNVVYDFTRRMKDLKRQPVMSLSVIKAMDYIYEHFQEKISLESVAHHVGLNKSYLCSLFKKETGVTIGSFITRLKTDAAKSMLIYTHYTPLEIGNYLAFSSHSHFISTFKKETGMTPKEYRDRNYRKHFDSDNG